MELQNNGCSSISSFLHHNLLGKTKGGSSITCYETLYDTQQVVKEREMEIGYPTDVKHVAHVGWDGPVGNGPSWMDDFNTAPDFSTSLGNLSELRDDSNPMAVTDLWSSQDSEQSSNIYNSIPSAGIPHSPEKSRQKKIKSATPTSQSRSASSRRPKATKSKVMYSGREATPIALM